MGKRPEHQLALLGNGGSTQQADLMMLTELIDKFPAFEIICAIQYPVGVFQQSFGIGGAKMLFHCCDLHIRIQLFKLARCYFRFVKTSVAVAE